MNHHEVDPSTLHIDEIPLPNLRRYHSEISTELFNVDFYTENNKTTAYVSWPAKIALHDKGKICKTIQPIFEKVAGKNPFRIYSEEHKREHYQGLLFDSSHVNIRVDLVTYETSAHINPGILVVLGSGAEVSKGFIKELYCATAQLPLEMNITKTAEIIDALVQEKFHAFIEPQTTPLAPTQQ
jgi:hypothetical protein